MQGIRSVISCSSCRQRKLRCDRTEPCSNCVSRKVDCVYASGSRRQNPVQRRSGNEHLDARLIRLEQLVSSIAEQRRQHGNPNDTAGYNSSARPPGWESVLDEHSEITPGRMVSNSNQTVYVSAVHWAAICDEIATVRELIQRDGPEHNLYLPERSRIAGPMLLQNLKANPDMEDVLADVPSRKISDRLVSRFFIMTEPANVMLHTPTFQKHYTRFWADPTQASLQWISLYFSILFVGTFLYVRSQDQLPEGFGDPAEAMGTYHKRSTECLIMSNYSTNPGNFTLEALLGNIHNEFIRQPDAHLGVWMLSGTASRLAMRMGYHRDPEHYPEISPFQGEMRRRVWALVAQLDVLTSCQQGLPSMIQEVQCDTLPPRNLLDEDLDPSLTELPKSRPETEITPVLYTIVKSRMVFVFRTLFNQILSTRVAPYEEIMSLDQRLHTAHNMLPMKLQISNLEDAITAPPALLMRRYNLEIFFQKSRCILHRHHMTESFQNPDYAYSRSSCVDAAMALLKHQARIYEEVQTGGRLYREKWFVSSLERHDFLLAAMIVCLELNSYTQHRSPRFADDRMQSPVQFSRDEMCIALQNTRTAWAESSNSSTEAMHASTILGTLLDNVVLKPTADQGFPFPKRDVHRSAASSTHESPRHEAPMSQASTNPSREDIEAMLNSPGFVNWDLWDAHMQKSDPAMEL